MGARHRENEEDVVASWRLAERRRLESSFTDLRAAAGGPGLGRVVGAEALCGHPVEMLSRQAGA